MTKTGTGSSDDPYIISTTAVIDPSTNLLSCGGSGLKVSPVLLTVAPGSCITVTGTGVSGDPFVLTTIAVYRALETFTKSGTLTVSSGVLRFRFPFDATITGVSAAVNTAPTGASIIMDVNKNGVSIFPVAPKPTIAIGAFDTGASEAVPDTTAISSGNYLQIDIDQIGSIVAGSDLSVFVQYTRAQTC